MSSREKRLPSKDVQVELLFLEAVAKRCPRNDRVLRPLGDLYTAAGRFKDGLLVDQQLVALCPQEPEVWYNFSCSLALVGDIEAAIEALNAAVDRGYRDGEWMVNDEDLTSLHGDPRFKAIVERLTPTTPSNK